MPLYVLNAAYPLVDDEFLSLLRGQGCGAGRRGRPAQLSSSRPSPRCCTRPAAARSSSARSILPMAGEYTGQVMLDGIGAFLRAEARAHAAGRDPRAQQARQRPRHPRSGRRRARPPAGLLHRLPGAADLRRDQAGRAGARQAPHRLRHRLPSVLDHAALRARRDHHGLRARARPRPRPSTRRTRRGARSPSSATAASGTTA